jgi:DNA polymerase III subunit gamma/tau
MTEHDKVAVRRESKKRAGKPSVAAKDAAPSADPEQALPATESASPERVLPATSPVDHSPRETVPDTRLRATSVGSSSYTVVARRYRPQRFEDVVGQDHVVQSLRNAIRLNRIAQAYLFCGTRGVGKTSIARIFAKCLNCVQGPTESPCQTCDICQAIATGQDVDVIEIDGASNNGVEQVRELRQNASLRPSRSRYKVYYIDEVHMLSTGAFNALLKTLEEPPAHVKFLFATTEPNKIPITVLSRCQRYDFAGITPDAIAGTLGEICTREGVESEHEALQVVARRVGGSLRDAQSLLDRLLASGSPKLTVEVVHSLLGTASDERLLKMLEALAGHDPAAALALLEQSASEGIQPAELLSGLIDLVRDAMILAVGGAESLLLAISPRNRAQLKSIVDRWTREPIIATLQILAECRGRMRGSVHGRLLVEAALVRAALLEELTSLSSLVERLVALESGTGPRRPEPGGIRMKPTVAEVPVTAMPASAVARSRAPLGEATPARADSQPAVGDPKPSQDPAVPVRAGATGAAPPDEATQATVPARQEAPADVIGLSSAVNALPDRAGSEPAAARAAAELSVREESSGSSVELAAAPEAAAPEAVAPAPARHGEPGPLDLETVRKLWPELAKKVDKRLALTLTQVEPIDLEGADVLVIAVKPGYNSTFADVDSPDAQSKIAQALQRLVHRPVRIKYVRRFRDEQGEEAARRNEARRADSLSKDPMVQRVLELFEARPVQMDYDEDDTSPEN